jgi:hypothetical protein
MGRVQRITIVIQHPTCSFSGWIDQEDSRQKPKEQNPQLRDFYQHKLSELYSYHLIFVDKSGCNKRVGHRRTGWSPLGVTPVQVSKFHRGQRYQILPVYTQEGILLSRIFKGSTDAVLSESFIELLLQHCGRWPEPKSVVIMDNTSFHHSDRVKQLCSDAGVRLLYRVDRNQIHHLHTEILSRALF